MHILGFLRGLLFGRSSTPNVGDRIQQEQTELTEGGPRISLASYSTFPNKPTPVVSLRWLCCLLCRLWRLFAKKEF
jgi:hypothetical protein